ncbi:uncharacterized protein LOC116344272 isoform X2 [Contarinia nasturtii]|nr:uncharacterized protein LOC116344272 isoform X2 [Contarinia nasturtii]XP_031628621.1 uncharacterized protein LOC116344272 isoform X2 [Contarinia nasturtii]
MEAACLRETDRHVELEDSLIAWQDKYERLHESHKRVQKVNQSLEDKLLKLVDRNTSERAQLNSDVATLSVRLAQANYNIGTLQREIERYKTDMSLAIQLLQCKPENFVSQKVTSLPHDMQTKLSQYIRVDTNSHSDSEGSTSGIGTATDNAYHILPASDSPVSSCPFSSSTTTSLVYGNGVSSAKNSNATNNGDDQMISPIGIAKYLEDKLKAANVKHCETCLCANRDLRVLADIDQTYNVGTQTILQGDVNFALCLRCNSNLNSPSSTNSPFILKLVKSCDSIVSDAKSSISCAGSNEKLLGKKDDLMVNPILGHTPISERTVKKHTTPNRSMQENLSSLSSQSCSKPCANNISHDSSQPKQHTTTVSNDELPRAKDSNRSHRQSERASSSSSLSNRSSAALDGSKLFESFNRNLIKSIKAEKPNLSGPRLCALRIPNGSGSILIDNIESDSTPVIYTRRSRFLDEELDESKDIITTSQYPSINGNTDQQQRTYHKISMLMSDGVITANSHESKSESYKANHKMHDTQDVDSIDVAQNYDECNQENECDQPNQKYCTNTTHITNDTIGLERNYNGLSINDHDISENIAFGESLQDDNQYQLNNGTNLKNEMESTNDKQQSQFMHMHQFRSTHPLSLDETSLLRRQQLSRVAEWVQNNNHEACHPDADYKQVLKLNNNSDEISNRSIDRNSKSLSMINCNSLAISDSEAAQKTIDYSQMNNNVNKSQLGSTNQQVDLAQMEYNVKQFLLKQNEWSPKEPPPPSPPSLSSVSHSYC